MLKTVIIDDETNAREVIKHLLLNHCHDVELVGEAEGVASGIQLINAQKPDLVLLDIHLKDGSGFDLLQGFDIINFQIIFITAYEKYALKAFKFSAIEYLLKPVDPNELCRAIEKAVLSVETHDNNLRLNAFFNNFRHINTEVKKIVLHTSESVYLINVNDIIRCQSEHNQTRFFLQNQEDFLVSKPLKEFDDMLNGYEFARVHKSHLVNLKYAIRFDKAGKNNLVLSDKSIIPVDSRSKVELIERFKLL